MSDIEEPGYAERDDDDFSDPTGGGLGFDDPDGESAGAEDGEDLDLEDLDDLEDEDD